MITLWKFASSSSVKFRNETCCEKMTYFVGHLLVFSEKPRTIRVVYKATNYE